MRANKFNEGEIVYYRREPHIVIDYKPVPRRDLYQYKLAGRYGWIYEDKLKGEWEYAGCNQR